VTPALVLADATRQTTMRAMRANHFASTPEEKLIASQSQEALTSFFSAAGRTYRDKHVQRIDTSTLPCDLQSALDEINECMLELKRTNIQESLRDIFIYCACGRQQIHIIRTNQDEEAMAQMIQAIEEAKPPFLPGFIETGRQIIRRSVLIACQRAGQR
jgi:hypothetical protein